MRRFFAPTMSLALKGGVEVVAAVDPDVDADVTPAEPRLHRPSAMVAAVENSDRHERHDHFRARPAPIEPAAAPATPAASAEIKEMRQQMDEMRTLLEQHLSLVKSVSSPLAGGDPQRAWLNERLGEMGLCEVVCEQIWAEVCESAPGSHWSRALDWLEGRIPMGEDRILKQGGVVALVGPSGVGKTTTAAKLAARYALRHGTSRVALVTTDNYRIGAQEQLCAFGELIGVSVHVAAGVGELQQLLRQLDDRDLVLIDTAGMGQRDRQLLEQLALLRSGEVEIDPYLVVSASTQARALEETVVAFGRVGLKGAILTKVDEGGELGAALSVLLRHQLPLLYLGDGQRVPEDLMVARGRDLVDQLVSWSSSRKESMEQLQGGLHNRPALKAVV